MPPPKALLDQRASDRSKTPVRVPATQSPARQPIGTEQTLNLLRRRNEARDDRETDGDAWATLSQSARSRARSLYAESIELLGALGDAQAAHTSLLRREWINFVANAFLPQINALDADWKVAPLERAFEKYKGSIATAVVKFDTEWVALEQRYLDERGWLARQKFDDAAFAVKRLDDLYNTSKHWLDGGAAAYITDEDYADFERTLATHAHISVGVLQGARGRADATREVLDTAHELIVNDQDPEKYLPGWRKQVDDEIASLDRLAKTTGATPGTDYPAEFARLRDGLRAERDAALTRPKEAPLVDRIGVKVVKVPIAIGEAIGGGVQAIAAPFVEAAREIIDEVQIGLYYVSGGRYLPTLTSDLTKAFAAGASRTDVLRGLVVGIIETPSRFLKAVEDGDWEAVGREAVNLYLLAKAAKESPAVLRRIPELLATARRAFRVLRARTLSLRINSGRFTPPKPPPLPPEPVFLRDPNAPPSAARQTEPTARPPESRPPEPSILREPPDHEIADAAFETLQVRFRELLRTQGREQFTVGRVSFSGVKVRLLPDGTLLVFRDIIQNLDRIPGRGRLIQGAYERATVAIAREVGARSARVAVGAVLNEQWAARLQNELGFHRDWIFLDDVYSNVLVKDLPL